MSAGSMNGSPTSPNGAATVRSARTRWAQPSVLEANPPGRRIVQSRPDSRTAASNMTERPVPVRPRPGPQRGQQHHPPYPAGPGHVDDLARPVTGDEQEQCVRPVERGLEGVRLGQIGPVMLAGLVVLAAWWCLMPGSGACRETAVTGSPASVSARTSGRPTFPVAPVTTIMNSSFVLSLARDLRLRRR